MVTLDYRTNNPRWGLKGILFQSWASYSLVLGYLSNPAHHTDLSSGSQAQVSLHIEGNNEQGAWDKEGRIHYYGSLSNLTSRFPDLADCSSAGTGRITKRINSNGYLLSLINDYRFKIRTHAGYTTADVIPPPDPSSVEHELRRHLMNMGLPNTQIHACIDQFQKGYHLSL